MRNLTLIFLFVLFALSIKAQKQVVPVYREVIVVTKEQTLKFQIKVLKQTISAKSDLTYYWYFADKVHSTEGSYDGYLLDGYYKEFNPSGALVTQGTFEKGVKTGEWKSFHSTGELKELSHYKDGKLNGEQKVYNEKGELIASYVYSGGNKRDLLAEEAEAKKQKEAKALAEAEKQKLKEEQKAAKAKEPKKKFDFKSLFKKKEKKAGESAAEPSKSK